MDRFFVENSFMDCSPVLPPKKRNLTEKNLQIGTKPQNSHKFSSSKVFLLYIYTVVYAVHAVHLVAFYDLIYELVC